MFLALVFLILPFSSKSHAIENHWANEAINYVRNKGIMVGNGNGDFNPDNEITRAEVMTTLNNARGYKEKAEINFKDVKEGSWYYEEVQKAVGAGYISGCGNDMMKPEDRITRQEVAQMVAKAYGLSRNESNPIEFIDESAIANWARESVRLVSENRVMIGDNEGKFNPTNRITRAEVAQIIYNIDSSPVDEPVEKVQKQWMVQSGAYGNKDNALIHVNDLINAGFNDAFILQNPDNNSYLVIVGKFSTKDKAEVLLNDVKSKGFDAFIKEIEVKEEEVKPEVKTPIISKTRTTVGQAQAWARNNGAHERFINVAPIYWEYGELTGINPEVLYCQAAKETGFGKYGGAVKPEMNNWAGIKVAYPSGDRTEDHETFATPDDGVRAHFNHMGIYCGVDPVGEPHPRWYITSTVGWKGQVQFVEDLGGKWAPNPDYGASIMRDYVTKLYNTEVK
nr:S-layer homology domain-containing protein [Anaerosalibacter bizertensis]